MFEMLIIQACLILWRPYIARLANGTESHTRVESAYSNIHDSVNNRAFWQRDQLVCGA